MKRILLLCLILITLFAPVAPAAADATLPVPVSSLLPLRDDAIAIAAPSAVLMERSTGTVIYEKNAKEHLSPASVTKVMTMLLVVEAIEAGTISLEEPVTASARAASMGGSQIWLEEGEKMSVGEMLKCVAVVSANDCCVALAEHLAGTEDAFVARMNRRAAELGMADTHFLCCSGLSESDDHYTCALDIARMSRELLGHELIKTYTTIWMDTIRDGAFGLSNTNKLIYYYPGATGLKTGFTSKAMFCLSASAERDGVEYIAVVLHAPTSADRFESAKQLLNYAFGNFTLVSPVGQTAIPPIAVTLGTTDFVQPVLPEGAGILVERSDAASLRYELELPEEVAAPVEAGQELGVLRAYAGERLLRETPLCAPETIERLDVWHIFSLLLSATLTGTSTEDSPQSQI